MNLGDTTPPGKCVFCSHLLCAQYRTHSPGPLLQEAAVDFTPHRSHHPGRSIHRLSQTDIPIVSVQSSFWCLLVLPEGRRKRGGGKRKKNRRKKWWKRNTKRDETWRKRGQSKSLAVRLARCGKAPAGLSEKWHNLPMHTLSLDSSPTHRSAGGRVRDRAFQWLHSDGITRCLGRAAHSPRLPPPPALGSRPRPSWAEL